MFQENTKPAFLAQQLCRHTEYLPPRVNKVRSLGWTHVSSSPCPMDYIKSSESGPKGSSDPSLSQHPGYSVLSHRLLGRGQPTRGRPSARSSSQSIAWNTWLCPRMPQEKKLIPNGVQHTELKTLGRGSEAPGNFKASEASAHPATWQLWATSLAPRQSQPPVGSQKSLCGEDL